ncbi:hypothetical protein P8452_56490 [Trifolium repens]|nr:hypothetical protein P8452_56490 [Trifolium repens]
MVSFIKDALILVCYENNETHIVVSELLWNTRVSLNLVCYGHNLCILLKFIRLNTFRTANPATYAHIFNSIKKYKLDELSDNVSNVQTDYFRIPSEVQSQASTCSGASKHHFHNTILLPSYVAAVICPLSIWENACVNGMKSSVELSNFSVYLKFNELRHCQVHTEAYLTNFVSLSIRGIEYQSFLKGSFIPLIRFIGESERVIHRFVDIIRRSTFKAKESSVQQKSGGSSSNLADASHFYILNVNADAVLVLIHLDTFLLPKCYV